MKMLNTAVSNLRYLIEKKRKLVRNFCYRIGALRKNLM